VSYISGCTSNAKCAESERDWIRVSACWLVVSVLNGSMVCARREQKNGG